MIIIMKINFYGADREVTGSCHVVEVNGKRIMVDCGLHQSGNSSFNNSFPFHPGEIDHVIITHAHIDHSGRLPLLVKQGFKGKIYATMPTCKLLDIMLRDSAHIQEVESVWSSRKKRRAGSAVSEPLYTMEDVLKVFPLLVSCDYKEIVKIDNEKSIRFTDAGHLLGSSYVEMWITEKNADSTTEGALKRKIVFSGDIGTPLHPIIRDPGFVEEADIVVMESTYGDRYHEEAFDTVTELANIIETTLAKGGNVICPAFAVGRTQDLIYHIREIKERGLVRSVPDFPVYLDSPLASAATKLYSEELSGYLDDETIALIDAGIQPLSFDGLYITESSEDSKRLNDDKTPKVIISSSGMCDAGRIRHHLKHNLWRSECAVVFTGFQALGTLGRIIVDGAVSTVSLFGDEIAIRSKIYNLRSMSSHADKNGLLDWIGHFKKKPECVFVVHGEEKTCTEFALRLIERDFKAIAPKYSSIYDLFTLDTIFEGSDLIRRTEASTIEKRESPVFKRLMFAGMRLVDVISRNKGGPNKELAKFADQIDSLSNKWDKP